MLSWKSDLPKDLHGHAAPASTTPRLARDTRALPPARGTDRGARPPRGRRRAAPHPRHLQPARPLARHFDRAARDEPGGTRGRRRRRLHAAELRRRLAASRAGAPGLGLARRVGAGRRRAGDTAGLAAASAPGLRRRAHAARGGAAHVQGDTLGAARRGLAGRVRPGRHRGDAAGPLAARRRARIVGADRQHGRVGAPGPARGAPRPARARPALAGLPGCEPGRRPLQRSPRAQGCGSRRAPRRGLCPPRAPAHPGARCGTGAGRRAGTDSPGAAHRRPRQRTGPSTPAQGRADPDAPSPASPDIATPRRS